MPSRIAFPNIAPLDMRCADLQLDFIAVRARRSRNTVLTVRARKDRECDEIAPVVVGLPDVAPLNVLFANLKLDFPGVAGGEIILYTNINATHYSANMI